MWLPPTLLASGLSHLPHSQAVGGLALPRDLALPELQSRVQQAEKKGLPLPHMTGQLQGQHAEGQPAHPRLWSPQPCTARPRLDAVGIGVY